MKFTARKSRRIDKIMKIANNITELIGNTPLVQLNKIAEGCSATILAKLEYMNPGRSCKDVIALHMINTAEKEGKITPGRTTLIECTSGNTGISLAYISAVKGYKIILIMPENLSVERRMIFEAYGAQVVLTPADKGMAGSLEKAKEISTELEDCFIINQFKNPANPEIHRLETAEEIWEATDGKVDIVIAGVGTGGTITGIAQKLKTKKPEFRAIAVEPQASAVISGCMAGKHKIEGIGTGFIPEVFDINVIDDVYPVSCEDAVKTACDLARLEAIPCGISGGAAVFAALIEAKKPENAGKNIVAIITDAAERYFTTPLFAYQKESEEITKILCEIAQAQIEITGKECFCEM